MPNATPFIPGLELASVFYREAVRPVLDAALPDGMHSAALLGYGSEVLGLDDERSRDHNWGPHALIFLSRADFDSPAEELRATLRARLPVSFRGYPVHFAPPDPTDGGPRVMAAGRPGEVDSLFQVQTWEAFLYRTLGGRRSRPESLDLLDWLLLPEQTLLEITAGAVFHDGLGTLTPTRECLAYFPDDVWLHRLSSQWHRLAEEEAFVGRCAEPLDPTSRGYFDRPFRVLSCGRFSDAVRARIQDERLRAHPAQLPAVDQLTDLSSAVGSPVLTGRMRAIYGKDPHAPHDPSGQRDPSP